MNYNDDNRFSGEYSNNDYNENTDYGNHTTESGDTENLPDEIPEDSDPVKTEDAADTTVVEDNAGTLNAREENTIPADQSTPTDQSVSTGQSSPYTINYNYADMSQNPFSQQGNQNHNTSGKPKKKRSTLPTLIGSAIIFGIVAAVCFQGVNEVAELLGISTKDSSGGAPVATIAPLTENSVTDNTETSGKQPASSATAGTYTTDVSALVEHTMPAIVSITSTIKGSGGYSFFGQYYENRDASSCGSGFIASQGDDELLIVTNNHVISGADSISVQFLDEEIVAATVKGTNENADLAILSVKLSDIKDSTRDVIRVAALGNSNQVRVGEMAVAIGNALGYGQSVTVGYISAKDREVSVNSDTTGNAITMKLLQTDAAINPGNSGGALMNMKGEVIGINSVKYASSEVEGMGFAIPISTAVPIINELMNREDLKDNEKGYLGVSVKTVTKEATNFDMPQGVYVDEVSKDGAADKAGIQKGDIITACNDIEVSTRESLQELINSYRIGTEVTLTIMRNTNGTYEEKKVTAKLQGAESLDSLTDESEQAPQTDAPANDDENNNNNDNSDDYYGYDNPYDYYDPFDGFNFGW